MFGQQNDKNDNQQIPDDAINGALSDDLAQPQPAADAPTTDQAPVPTESWGHPGQPFDTNGPSPVAAPLPATINVAPQAPPADDFSPHDLIDIKQQALTKLSPLVDHLEQTPEEKFRTTMMMIQASDDQSLVKVAYEAAGKIEDEKIRAQALLDIVNEINYFTSHHEQPADAPA